jgi:hypothetical protein
MGAYTRGYSYIRTNIHTYAGKVGSVDNGYDFCSGISMFEFRPVHGRGFLASFRRIPGQCLKIVHDHFHPHAYQFSLITPFLLRRNIMCVLQRC